MLWSNSRMSSVVKGISAAGTGRPRRQRRALAAAVLEAMETRRLLTAFSYTGSIQTYSVPTTGSYELSIAGAQGGASNDTSQNVSSDAEAGGLGAVISGDVTLTAGTVLQVVVGGQGTTGTGADAGGGGGGSFVFVSGAPQPIVVAGGGGGAAFQYATTGADAQTSENGSTPQNTDQPGTGGTNGSGGTGGGVADYGGAGGGGAGWSGNGGNATNDAGAGGFNAPTFAGGPVAQSGGFGGGGGGSVNGGGGGGGYSGGGGGAYSFGFGINGFIGGGGGGGGGSYTADLTSLTSAVTQTGNGYFDITPLATPTITSAAQPASAAVGNTIADKATVSGGNSPAGTVTFNLYSNATATGPALFTDTETLSGGIATSASYTPIATGTDYWVATYNGDSNNAPVSTVDNADPVTVTGSLVVTSTSDSPAATGNTLRDAIAYADSLTGPQTVTFASALTAGGPATITLTNGNLPVTGSLTITGPGENALTIDGDHNDLIFEVDSQSQTTQNVAITGLTLTDGIGAIDNNENLTLEGDVISDNSTSGVTNEADATLTSSNDTFIDNIVNDAAGGGIQNAGTVYSSNDTFSGNSALDGGAIANLNDATLTDDTITQNTVTNPPPGSSTGYGGGVFTYGATLAISDTIIAGNTAATAGPDVTGTFTSDGHNLIGDGTGGSGFVSSDQVGTSATPIDAMLGTLGNYGGPTPTVPLLAGSPAIGEGVIADYSGTTIPLTADQRGVPRPATPDIGAFEYDYNLVVNSNADNAYDDNVSGPTVTLREAINFTNAYPGNPTITFASTLKTQTIKLTAGNLHIEGSLTIAGLGANELTIDGDKSGSFVIDSVSATSQNVAITGLTITDAPGAIDDAANLTLSSDTISNNRGPGVTIESTGTLTSSGNAFLDNVESNYGGGGISNYGTLYSSDDTFSGNSGANGGGIYSEGNGTLSDDTITQNKAVASFPSTGYAGGVYVLTGTLTVADTLIAGNTADEGSPDVSGGFTSSGHNLIGDGTGGSGFVASDQVGTSAAPINPLLAPLGNYGGTTPTQALLPGSPAIGAGIPGASEVQQITVSGDPNAGDLLEVAFNGSIQYTLGFTGASTVSSLAYTLDELPTLGGVGGSVTVQLASSSGETFVFDVTFAGSLADAPEPLISVQGSGDSASNTELTQGFAAPTTDQTGYTRSSTAPSIGAYENEGFTITASSGTPQSTAVSTAFGTPLGVSVKSNNALLTDLAGGVITFTAPSNGASATFGTNPITLIANGTGSTAANANAIAGRPYTVTATGAGVTNTASFSLTNNASIGQLTGTPSANTSGSYNNDGNTYLNAFDGNTSTFFDSPNASGNYVQLDLGSAKTITEIAYAPRQAFESRMVGGVVEASNDPTFATGVVTLYTIASTPADGLTTQSVSPGAAYRYVRYVAPANSYGNIAELQVFGPGGAASTAPTYVQLKGTASANTTGSYDNDGDTYLNAFDGNLNTFFDAPTGSGNYVELNLGSPTAIAQIAYSPRQYFESRMDGGYFEASNDPNFNTGVTTLFAISTTPQFGLTTQAVTGTYQYIRYVSPSGSYGNIAEFQVFGPATAPPPATPTAPGMPTLSNSTDTTATIAWTASASSDVTGYLVLRNGTQVGSTSGTTLTYTDAGLTPSTTYSYTVEAVAGAVDSAPTLPLGVTTPPAPATTGNIQLTGTGSANTTGSYDGKTSDNYTAVFDGNTNTFFDAPTANGNYVTLNLGSVQEITQIKFAPRVGFESRMGGGYFEASNDPNFATGVVTLDTIISTPADGLNTITISPNVSYQYIRYVSPNGSYGNIAELQVFGPGTAAPTATQLTGTASANTTGSYDGKTSDNYTAVFDGNTNTFFDAPTASGNYVQLDLGSPQTITSIAFAPRAGFEYRMNGGYFEASNDPTFSSGVTVLYTITSTPSDGLTSVNVSAVATGTYRYVRYVSPANSYGNIAEMQVFGY